MTETKHWTVKNGLIMWDEKLLTAVRISAITAFCVRREVGSEAWLLYIDYKGSEASLSRRFDSKEIAQEAALEIVVVVGGGCR